MHVALNHISIFLLKYQLGKSRTVTSIGNWQCAPSCSALSQNSSTIINSSSAVKQSTSFTSLARSGSGVLAPLPFSTPEPTLSVSVCCARWAPCLATFALTRSVAWRLVFRRCAANCCLVKDQALYWVDVRYKSSSDSFMLAKVGVAASTIELALLELDLELSRAWAGHV